MALGQGGAAAIITAMVRAIEAAGGEVRLDAPVKQVAVENGVAKGVVLANGERIDAKRAVIANLHPRVLFGDLVGGTSPAAAEARKVSARTGDDDDPSRAVRSAAVERRRRVAQIRLCASRALLCGDGERPTPRRSMDCCRPNRGWSSDSRPRSIRRARRPDSTCCGCRCGCCLRKSAATPWASSPAREWDEVKEAYADRVVDLIARYAPGFSASILDRTVLSPADLERDNPNLVGGDSLGGSHHLDQNFLFRPAFGWSRYRTPVKRLYMVGASTWPGAGTGAGSGFMLAKILAGA